MSSSADDVYALLARRNSGNHDLSKLRILVADASFEPNGQTRSGLTPLKAGIMTGNAEEIAVLIGAGCEVAPELIEFARTRYPHKEDVLYALLSPQTNAERMADLAV